MINKSLFSFRLLFLLGCSLLTPSCFDEITLDLPETEEQKMVIEGYVNQGTEYLDVFLAVGVNANISDLTGNISPIPITQAYLIYNEVAFPNFPLTNNQITRLPVKAFAAQAPGSEAPSFSLLVELPNGQIYQSTPERLPPLPKAENIDVGLYTKSISNELGNIIERTCFEIKLTTPLRAQQAEKSFLKWDLEGVYRFVESPPTPEDPFQPQNTCYLNHNLGQNQILIFNGRESTEEKLERYPVLQDIPVNYYFASGYYLTVYQQSLSGNAYRYWDQLRQNASQGDGLFEPAPGSVQGNIKNINDPAESVLGYFYATQTDTLHQLIRAEEVGRPRAFCYTDGNQQSDRCIDCNVISGGTMEKPAYWID